MRHGWLCTAKGCNELLSQKAMSLYGGLRGACYAPARRLSQRYHHASLELCSSYQPMYMTCCKYEPMPQANCGTVTIDIGTMMMMTASRC